MFYTIQYEVLWIPHPLLLYTYSYKGDNALSRSHSWQNKQPVSRTGYSSANCWSYVSQKFSKIIQDIVKALYRVPELCEKILLFQAKHSLVTSQNPIDKWPRSSPVLDSFHSTRSYCAGCLMSKVTTKLWTTVTITGQYMSMGAIVVHILLRKPIAFWLNLNPTSKKKRHA